ncbi:Crp/Fnr family transcriptional regulator [Roseibium sediminicola]|uniref:Crp/Fnr family transcriptional regulator n=1 Tax=Roseibium sediminicola TaxID=2933272 RepID=A0ABT0H2W0_9HYPH|nr:Crp/Fnr family transcriptional regulator [Roseibium sp. CAU 1639]MCK7615956.1 Crp/Fnr family transcriptional regulator [Roseibium sp. CAU 1639]
MELYQSGTWLISDTLMSSMVRDDSLFVRRHFRKDEEIYVQESVSSKFYVVVSGLVQIAMIREDGTEVILELMGPQTVCGEGAAIDGLPRFSGATALEETELLEFDASQLPQLAAHSPEFVVALLQITALKQRVLAVRLEQLSSREPETRIMEMFARLARIFAETRCDGKLIVPKLTHEQIAAMTGNTRVTVTRALGRLKERGEIAIVNGRILLMSERFRD